MLINTIGNNIQSSSSGGVPSALTDGNTVLWVDSTQNITKDGSNRVSLWGDKSGNGNDLVGNVDTDKQPTYSSDGILFDGSTDYLKAVAFTLVQPEFIYIVVKQVAWSINKKVFDGDVANSGALQMGTSTPNLIGRAGSSGDLNGDLAVGTFGIVRLLFNGASSTLQVDEGTVITSDNGTDDMSGFTLGASGGLSALSNIEVKEIIIRKVADGAGDESAIYNYLSNKYAI